MYLKMVNIHFLPLADTYTPLYLIGNAFFKMEDLLVNLRVIAVLQPYQRLHTRQVHFRIYQHRFLPELLTRWIDGATRRSDFGRIRDVYTSALENLNHPECWNN